MKTKSYKISTPVFAILALILFAAMTTKAAPGDLDLTFSGDGKPHPDPAPQDSAGPRRIYVIRSKNKFSAELELAAFL